MSSIIFENQCFCIDTNNTSYRFMVNERGHLESLYYGPRLIGCDVDALRYKRTIMRGTQVAYDEADPAYCLDDIPLEWSSIGRGDYRNSPIEAIMPDGSFVSEWIYTGHSIVDDAQGTGTLPSAYGEGKTLIVSLKDAALNVVLKLYYTVFLNSDVICRRVVIENCEQKPLILRRLMSFMLDLSQRSYTMTTFDGDWIAEANRHDRIVEYGTYINESTTGFSSNRHNAGIVLSERTATEDHGLVYGFNLIYSGNHYTSVQKAPTGLVRVMSGISPHCFNWVLNENDSFETPQAVMICSNGGFNGMSQGFHSFINNHIVRGDYKNKPRPVLYNNWEACFFKFGQRKLERLARGAKKLGVELFVLDDGWFSTRNSDNSGLGDYWVNRKKLPHGLEGLSKRVGKLGMKLGLWFEPESVNIDSDLFREHPSWAITTPNRAPLLGRHQLLLDLTNSQVRDYIVKNVSGIIDNAKLSYVKWDMNRHMSDAFCLKFSCGEFYHRYIMGLYEVLGRIFNDRGHVLLEMCASGGNRFDLGMLCFAQQIWASDDTDPIERLSIQRGLSYLYPQSVMGAHVSMAPHQQTLRNTPLATRFNVAAFGCLGYELDLDELSYQQKSDIKSQIAFYKQHRSTLQYGTLYRFNSDNPNRFTLQVVSQDGKTSLLTHAQTLAKAADSNNLIFFKGLHREGRYSFDTREQRVYVGRLASLAKHVLPIKLKPDGFVMRMLNRYYTMADGKQSFAASGSALMGGVQLERQFIGTGYNQRLRVLGDFGSNMYIIWREA